MKVEKIKDNARRPSISSIVDLSHADECSNAHSIPVLVFKNTTCENWQVKPVLGRTMSCTSGCFQLLHSEIETKFSSNVMMSLERSMSVVRF